MFFRRQLLRQAWPLWLLLILALAAGLRFYNLRWDSGTFAHPDERSTVMFYAPTIRWPDDSSKLFDPRASTLNPFWEVNEQRPRSYTYGHFPLYTLVLTAHALQALAGLPGLPPEWAQFLATASTPPNLAVIGRALVALADLFTVYLLFLLGRRLYGLWGGLLAAALSACTVLQIQLAHFFAVDPISTTFTVLALYGATIMVDRPSRGAAMLTGLGIGLAVASKFSALPVAFAPIMAAYFASRRPRKDEKEADIPTSNFPLHPASFGLVLLCLGVAFMVFAITSPFVFLDFETFKRAVIDEQGSMVSGVADWPFTRQYRGTMAYWYFIEQQLQWGMGWPLGLLAIGGTLWVVFRALRGKASPGEWLILGWLVLYFGPTGLFLAKFMRYMVPVVPFLTLFGAGMVMALWRAGEARSRGDEETGRRGTEEIEAEISPPTSEPKVPWRQPSSSPSPLPPRPSAPLWGKWIKAAAVALALGALTGAALWSLAFVNGVHGQEHPWYTFARWTYANIPDGSCIAREHWDEGIPASIDAPDGHPAAHGYRQPELPMYEEDTQQKYETLRSTLLTCDYIAIASNRLWRTIPKLSERYPMSTRYYEALFSGQLGFEQIYTVQNSPRLGPWVVDDQSADESFTVYDHPRPILFKKTRQLTPVEWDALLGNTWQNAIPGYTGPSTLLMRLRGVVDSPQTSALSNERRESKTLMLNWPVDQLPVVNDFHWNGLANGSTLAAVLVWWLAVVLLGMLAWPLTWALFHHLPDRGYGLSKSLGLLLVSYFVWLMSSLGLLYNSVLTAVIGLILLGAASFWVVRTNYLSLQTFWQQRRLTIVITEAVFALVYLYFIGLRLLNPDLWQPWLGGEKMLEIGFLNAVVKSAVMPPYDPFFAGGIMNYYYYGLFIVGVLIKLTGIQPSIAFNLAVPSLAALTAVNVFTLAGNLAQLTIVNRQWSITNGKSPITKHQLPVTNHTVRALYAPLASLWDNSQFIISGSLAILFVLFIGNLEGAAQFLRELGRLSQSNFHSAIPGLQMLILALSGLTHVLGGEFLAPYNYWDPTRVIPATINEFPYFSFLFADLHPHMIGLPFTVLFLALAYNWLNESASQQISAWSASVEEKAAPEFEAETPLSPLSQLSFTHSLTAHSLIRSFAHSLNRAFLRWLALPFVLGAIAAINTWDLPTYLGLMAAIFLLARYRQEVKPLTLKRALLLLISSGLFAGVLLGATYLFYAPFFANYQPPAETGLGVVHTQTALDQHLKIWGFFLFVLVSWLWLSLLYPGTRNSFLRTLSLSLRRWNVWPHLNEIYGRVVTRQNEQAQLAQWAVGLVLIITVGLWLLGYLVPAYLLPLAALALILLFRPEVRADTAYLGVLTFTGLLVLLGLEFFFLRDFLGGGEYFRMNTLFKFYIQVWVMMALVSAVVLPRLWRWSERWPLPGLLLWRAALAVLMFAVLIYPILGTRTRVDDRFPGDANRPPIGTLDGLAYMTVGVFEWPAGSPIQLRYDYEAIRWLQDNIRGTPIIAEAKIGYYREGGMRVAAYTGLPSILGGLHQNEQRYAWQVGDRDFLVSEFWSSPDPGRTLQLLDQLGISYVYVGQIERITHGPQIQGKFDQLLAQGALELVFENEQTRIYKRVR